MYSAYTPICHRRFVSRDLLERDDSEKWTGPVLGVWTGKVVKWARKKVIYEQKTRTATCMHEEVNIRNRIFWKNILGIGNLFPLFFLFLGALIILEMKDETFDFIFFFNILLIFFNFLILNYICRWIISVLTMEGKSNNKTIIVISHNSFVMYNSFTGKLIPSSFHWYIYIVYLIIRMIIIVRLLFNILRCTRGVNIAFDRYKSREQQLTWPWYIRFQTFPFSFLSFSLIFYKLRIKRNLQLVSISTAGFE